MTKKERGNFGSKLGVILASAGSAVGLGNIWRFPYETGNHGGAAFILIYLGCILLLGLPIMIAEFLIGRHSQANTARAYQILAPGTQWRWVGRMGGIPYSWLLLCSGRMDTRIYIRSCQQQFCR
jgi:NSS family neurotransmitter:Na+ symporter